MTPIVEKGLPSTRAAAKQSAIEALLQYIEVDKADPIIEEILPALSHKQPKIITASLVALTTIFHNYGVKIVDPKPVLKAVPKCFGHADKNVRAEASNLVVELYRWLREAIKTLFWNDLKPVQQQDLEKLFEQVKQEAPPKQERLLRSQQNAPPPPTAGEGDGGEVEDAGEGGEVEVVDLAEPIDVYSKIPKNFQENMASSKWKDRKDALDGLLDILRVDRIQPAPFDEPVAILAKCMKDANIAVVTVAANCVEALAKGLRRSFAKYHGKISSPMFERLKEKKQSVADALGAALDAVFMSTSLSECLDEIMEFLKHKNPQVKLETLRFLIRCLKNTRVAPSAPETKAIADAATKLLTESTEVTRSGGAEVLGTLMKIMGERQMNPYLDGLDDIRKTKIKEFYDVAEVKAKNKPKPAAAPKAAPAAQKKVVGKKPGATPGAGVKKPAPRPLSPEAPPTPTQAPRSIARPGLGSKLGGPGKSGLAAPSAGSGPGLRLPKKLSGPGGAAPSHLASPKRSLTPHDDDAPPTAPRAGLGQRSLAGRPLSKPGAAHATASPPPAAARPAPIVGLSSVERAELEELRADRTRLQGLAEELRAERAKLELELDTLRTHEAELVEERTRNRLTIKAKETQLTRARADADVAQQTCDQQRREMDRLKRELARTVRAPSPGPYDVSDHIFRDAGAGRPSAGGGAVANPAANGRITPAALDRYESTRASREVGYQRARSYMGSPSEEKENAEDARGARKGSVGSGASSARLQRELSDGRSGDGSPSRPRQNGDARGSGAGGEPIESWRRAAEVTSQLKARIEQMKVCEAPEFVHSQSQALS